MQRQRGHGNGHGRRASEKTALPGGELEAERRKPPPVNGINRRRVPSPLVIAVAVAGAGAGVIGLDNSTARHNMSCQSPLGSQSRPHRFARAFSTSRLSLTTSTFAYFIHFAKLLLQSQVVPARGLAIQ